MGCGSKEKKGTEEVFESFQSNVCSDISVDKAKAQEAEAEKARAKTSE